MSKQELIKKVRQWSMPFGKYKGKKFRDIDDDDYIEWIVYKTNFFKDNKYPSNKMILEYLKLYLDDALESEEESVKDISGIVQHVEKHNITTIEWINGNIIKLEELITNYEVMNDEDVNIKTVIHELQRCQRYLGEIIDIINFRS